MISPYGDCEGGRDEWVQVGLEFGRAQPSDLRISQDLTCFKLKGGEEVYRTVASVGSSLNALLGRLGPQS